MRRIDEIGRVRTADQDVQGKPQSMCGAIVWILVMVFQSLALGIVAWNQTKSVQAGILTVDGRCIGAALHPIATGRIR